MVIRPPGGSSSGSWPPPPGRMKRGHGWRGEQIDMAEQLLSADESGFADETAVTERGMTGVTDNVCVTSVANARKSEQVRSGKTTLRNEGGLPTDKATPIMVHTGDSMLGTRGLIMPSVPISKGPWVPATPPTPGPDMDGTEYNWDPLCMGMSLQSFAKMQAGFCSNTSWVPESKGVA
ncbi:deformed epidermal autoregulatory factor 1 homolog [Narcine bancroftii]|uniref:deformed epidermal autoregulatory factor 1 homolog n=1 Tax=Narcine bancroftii TaxID=1343680 RepID=UPI003831E4EB